MPRSEVLDRKKSSAFSVLIALVILGIGVSLGIGVIMQRGGIDIRVITDSFKAEKTLTRDTVPVDVDAVLFWKVRDPEKAVLNVADYKGAIS